MITAPKEAIFKITHCTICGSDLHMYEFQALPTNSDVGILTVYLTPETGELDSAMQEGDIMGHEAIGIVDDIGLEVETVEKGDRVIILPVIACGACFYCKPQEYSLCDKTNPTKDMDHMWGHRLSGIFGYTHLIGGYPGNQAQYCRVPNANIVLVKAPNEGVSPEKLLALADVTRTAWDGCELAEVDNGDVVGVWGCEPIGLSIVKLSFFRGAKKVYAVEPDPGRLKIAESFGCIGVDFGTHASVSDYILDKGIEANGFRSAQS
ncbi:hypothetical protein OEA41_001888 [Lepraria neglecta]|uniref:Alcohol dehydrogenase-like N-terminal domain-containing protein n=1 Tax=Lepraria neglecta TaxID=209136 RepID=A0AAD9ZDZ4_9LECA|nr:hypothetical protein OEA41_001888 [Lepraria neglecta]